MITSTSNPRVKRLAGLKKKRRLRDEEGVFIVEGLRMLREIPRGELLELYVSEKFLEKEREEVKRLAGREGIKEQTLSERAFAFISDTKAPQGAECIVRQRKPPSLSECMRRGGASPLFLALDNIQDPGNLGTMLRTAEAAGAAGVVLGKDCADVYNPKTIRSTMGAVFRLPFWYAKDLSCELRKFKERGIRIFAAQLEEGVSYERGDYTAPCAFLIGNEGNGLKETLLPLSDGSVHIPMGGGAESLNAAVAAAVLMFEAARQKRERRNSVV